MRNKNMPELSKASIPEAFSYELKSECIAQRPVHPYDAAKLLVVSRASETLTESCFSDISNFLNAGDLLVFNNSRVIPARLFGRFADTSDASNQSQIEVLLLQEQAPGIWNCMARPLKKFKIKRIIQFPEDLQAEVLERTGEKSVLLRFSDQEKLKRVGQMPIPPYIRGGKSDAQDLQDYQPHFAKVEGSIAAPTASLHFTPDLLQKLRQTGVEIEYLTLHVGAASFLPLWSEGQAELSEPSAEQYIFSQKLIDSLNERRKQGGRVIAVGTTVVRALESMCRARQQEGQLLSTDLFIYPGFTFQMVDAVVTNFHQPRTTHLLLVQAFLGRTLLERSYQYALENDFRFLSYGDGQLLL